MKLDRNYITPFIPLFDGYTEVVHEHLGVFFVVCSVFHIILNWKGLRVHFKKGVFIPALLGVLAISVTLIVGENMYPPVDTIIINKIVKAPINDALKALDVDYSEAVKRLETNGISIDGATTIESIWINNNVDPEKVIDLITE